MFNGFNSDYFKRQHAQWPKCNTIGFNGRPRIPAAVLESCLTIQLLWLFNCKEKWHDLLFWVAERWNEIMEISGCWRLGQGKHTALGAVTVDAGAIGFSANGNPSFMRLKWFNHSVTETWSQRLEDFFLGRDVFWLCYCLPIIYPLRGIKNYWQEVQGVIANIKDMSGDFCVFSLHIPCPSNKKSGIPAPFLFPIPFAHWPSSVWSSFF